MVIIIIEA